jgi:hypothetical protein
VSNHLITPPPELVEELQDFGNLDAIQLAYAAGADQELEACIEWVRSMFGGHPTWADELRAARRPRPPSLKEQALEALEVEDDAMPLRSLERSERFDTIRRALEALPDE